MELIEGVSLSKLCDYSFGDQGGQWGNIYTSFMKDANLTNTEFVSKIFEISEKRNYMTLFIDNIRLYKREIVEVKDSDRHYVNSLHEKNDLLNLCSFFPEMNFIIFTNLEDTPIDEFIFDKIPSNVLCISAVNAISHGGKVIPAPYGLQRRMHPNDDRIDVLQSFMKMTNRFQIKNLLYINHNDNSHQERNGIKNLFLDKSWAHVNSNRINYSIFLKEILESMFVVCPRGNAIDCHRNWEVIFMRRVPVMKRHEYLEVLFKDYPVLFVNDYREVTEEFLDKNKFLYDDMKKINLENLTLPNFYNKIVSNSLK